jgi:hypothetical protein
MWSAIHPETERVVVEVKLQTCIRDGLGSNHESRTYEQLKLSRSEQKYDIITKAYTWVVT